MDRVICQWLEAMYQDGVMIREDAPTISDEALAHCRQVLTDERLDWMAERYRSLGIHYWTGAEFHKFLLYPDALEAEADRKRRYVAMRLTVRGHDYGLVVTTN